MKSIKGTASPMSATPLIVLFLSTLLLSGSCSESTPSTAPEEPKTQAPEEPETEKGMSFSGLLKRGSSLGENALESGRATAENAASTVTDTLAKGNEGVRSALSSAVVAFEDGQSWSGKSLSELKNKSESLMSAAGDKVGLVRDAVNSVVKEIATTNLLSDRDKIERIVVLMLPVVGPSKRYLDARTLYADGQRESDESKVSQARRETLLACAEMGLDIGTFGLLGTNVDRVTTGAEKLLVLLKVGRTVNVLSGSDSDLLSGYLDSLLEEQIIVNAIDSGLAVGS